MTNFLPSAPARRKCVLINGFSTSGKDTFIRLLRDILKERQRPTYQFFNLSRVDLVKEALEVLGWDGKTKTPELRDLMIELKDKTDTLFDSSLSYLETNIHRYFNGRPFVGNYMKDYTNSGRFRSIMFIHIREPEGMRRLVDFCKERNYAIESLLVVRPGLEPITGANDAGTVNWDYTWTFTNPGDTLENFRKAVEAFIDG